VLHVGTTGIEEEGGRRRRRRRRRSIPAYVQH
jgi:hypothetical protein